MNFFKQIDALNDRYQHDPKAREVAANYIKLFHDYLVQLKEISTKKQTKTQP